MLLLMEVVGDVKYRKKRILEIVVDLYFLDIATKKLLLFLLLCYIKCKVIPDVQKYLNARHN